MSKRQLLGAQLLSEGLITGKQLDAALATQKKLHGRIGSNLVELGFIDLKSLSAALGRQLGFPIPERTDLMLLDQTVARRLPARASELYKAVPLAMSPTDAGAIRIAMADPTNLLAIDELSTILGARIEPLVAPELRIFQLQQRLYGIKPVRRTLLQMGGDKPIHEQLRAAGKLEARAPRGSPNPGEGEGRRPRSPRPLHTDASPTAGQARALQLLAKKGRAVRTAPSPQPADAARPSAAELRHNVSHAPAVTSNSTAHGAPGRAMSEPRQQLASHPQGEARGRQNTPPTGLPRHTHASPATLVSAGASASKAARERRAEELRQLHQSTCAAQSTFATASTSPGLSSPDRRDAQLREQAHQRPAVDSLSIPNSLGLPKQRASTKAAPESPESSQPFGDLAEEDLLELLRLIPEPQPASPAIEAEKHGPAVPEAAIATKTPMQWALIELEAAIEKSDVANAIVRYLSQAFGCGLILVVKKDVALGWKAAASKLDEAVIEATMIPLGIPSVFQSVLQTAKLYRGPAPADGAVVHQRLWKVLHAPPPREVLVAPLTLGSRIVNLVYTHSSPDSVLPMMAEADLATIVSAAAGAYQRLIRRRHSSNE